MKCCICGKEVEAFRTNNPQPIRREDGQVFDGINERCCNACNSKYVINYRIAVAKNYPDDIKELQKAVYALRLQAGINIKKRYLVCTIERNDGSTYEQQCAIINDSIRASIDALIKTLGKDYYVADYRVEED